MIYYVYLYLRKNDLTPYYVGKGKGRRAWNGHLVEVPKEKSRIVIIAHKLSENEAFLLEKTLINYYGRKVNNTGILENIAPGGYGGDTISNHPRKKEIFENRDNSHRTDPYYIKQVSESMTKKWQEIFEDPTFDIEAYKQMCSKRTSNMWEDRGFTEEDRKKRSTTWLKYMDENPNVLEDISKSVKKHWQKISKTYEVTFPDGHIKQVKCLRGWCEENSYPYFKIYGTIRYNRPSPEGWMAKVI